MVEDHGHPVRAASASRSRMIVQIVWGAALVLAGLGVFYRTPEVLQKALTIEQFAAHPWILRSCFYLLGALLIVGGAKKIYDHALKIK